jgi:hypothetical protein
MSPQAGGIGQCRPSEGGVGPHHAPNNALTPWRQQPWVSPPQANAACVWALEDVVEVYTRPDDPRRPPVCLDEPSKHVVADPRESLPATPGPPARVAYAEERTGTAHLCMVVEPLAGPRPAQVTERRTAVDCAPRIQALGDAHDPPAEKLVLVMAHRNTPQPASRSEAFAPADVRRLMERLAMHETPTHGRWLHMAETARSVRATPCVDRRLPDPTPLTPAVAAWEPRRNAAKCRVDWRFTTLEARIKLKRLYPSIQLR